MILFTLRGQRIVRNCFAACTLFLSAFFPSRYAYSQNTLDAAGLSASSPASVAYSLRRLSTAYAGSLVQVRRSSDNTTQDIGFTGNGDLDTVALKNFTGAANAFVVRWYDQSGNGRDLTQTTNTRQPSMVDGGIIVREKGRPAIRFTGFIGSGTYQSLNLATAMTTVGHVAAVQRFASGGDGFLLGHFGSYYWHSDPAVGLLSATYASTSVKGGLGWRNGVATAPDQMPWPVALTVTQIEPSTPGTNTAWDNIGSDRSTAHNTTDGAYGELIVFPAALTTTERQAMQTNILTYFALNSSLPVTWHSFSVQRQGDQALLQWQTATEQNTRHFVVQHSSDGSTWKDIAVITAAGNSSTIRSYQYVQARITAGMHYYRLLQTDLDGKQSYSAVRVLSTTARQAAFEVRNTLNTTTQFNIQFHNATMLAVYDNNGKRLLQKQFPSGLHVLDMSSYAKGVYILKGKGSIQKIFVR